jgi:hypothetical protein
MLKVAMRVGFAPARLARAEVKLMVEANAMDPSNMDAAILSNAFRLSAEGGRPKNKQKSTRAADAVAAVWLTTPVLFIHKSSAGLASWLR